MYKERHLLLNNKFNSCGKYLVVVIIDKKWCKSFGGQNSERHSDRNGETTFSG